ncbi:MAG TPA: tRNA (adenosine(37)-N6)-dimethylallyltransferase MiaA [Candidatus Polarisedimenticolia bacterium]|nr:tRNA (adenosine(37)-N6)-dimethylallyltransferase MiaA [Candidatus Polarisedimenticolia bacterium]
MPGGDLLVILGPTATGKSELALRLARRLGGWIINADSIQVYRGLDAGSCKPSREARRLARHELIDVADPAEPFSAGTFARLAGEAIDACHAAGARPIVAGGTGLYLRALLHGIAPMPPRDEAVRAALYARAAAGPVPALHRELAAIDPVSASRIGPNDLQRIVRALEVHALTGRSLEHHIAASRFRPGRRPAVLIGLRMDKAALHRRIEARVDRMFEAGLVQEVRGLLASGVPASANALKALGYREAAAHIRAEIGLDDAIRLVKRNTRRYARRQRAWFGKEAGVHWLDVPDEAGGGLRELEERAAALLDGSGRGEAVAARGGRWTTTIL